MIICVDITDGTKSELDELLVEGGYGNYSEAISIAISNQRILHRRIPKSGSLLDPQIDTATPRKAQQSPQPSHGHGELQTIKIPEMFVLKNTSPIEAESFIPAPLPDDAFVPGQDVTVDRWIWGQYNRFLPLKASCRGLLYLLGASDVDRHGIPLSKATSEISSHAVSLGDYFRAADSKYELTRDDALSTAFPFSGSEREDKARLRYANQFVAGTNKHERLTGFLVDLKLVNLVRAKTPKVLLTQPGWDFATLPNPILDSPQEVPPTSRLSEDERNILLRHISLAVPAEDAAYRTILTAVVAGADTPETLDLTLKKFLPERTERPFTDAFISTQRSGAISRMADLGLIERVRTGIRVKYVMTEVGKTYVQGLRGRKTV